MGVWYFLLLFAGLFLVGLGIVKNKKWSLIVTGAVCISLSLFMFSPGSDELISNLFNLN